MFLLDSDVDQPHHVMAGQHGRNACPCGLHGVDAPLAAPGGRQIRECLLGTGYTRPQRRLRGGRLRNRANQQAALRPGHVHPARAHGRAHLGARIGIGEVLYRAGGPRAFDPFRRRARPRLGQVAVQHLREDLRRRQRAQIVVVAVVNSRARVQRPNARSKLTQWVSSASVRSTSAKRSSVRSRSVTGCSVQARSISRRRAAHGCT